MKKFQLTAALCLLVVSLTCFAACGSGTSGGDSTAATGTDANSDVRVTTVDDGTKAPVETTVLSVESTATTVETTVEPGETTAKPMETTVPVPATTIEPETERPELEWETYDSALDDSTVNTSAEHKVDSSQWVAVDGLDRVLPTNSDTGNTREDKTVAMFYWTWHGNFADGQYAYNNQRNLDALEKAGLSVNAYWDMTPAELTKYGVYTGQANAMSGAYHFWDEPIYGYYDGDDEWVIRKQGELLAAAGVDVVFFDNTNGGFTWLETAMKVMKVFSEARAEGVDTPDVSFMLPFAANDSARSQIVELYNNIYNKGLYEDVWYYLDGKPMLMGYSACLNIEGNTFAAELKEFFTFRANIPGYTTTESAANQWGWLSVYPQAYFHNAAGEIEQMTVGVAMNHNYVTNTICPLNHENIINRTWTSRGYDTSENALYAGACFSQQWQNAISVDPGIIFVTGWNEWVAMKMTRWDTNPPQYNCFVDQYNDIASRDCEPSNGPMKDYYYYQLVSYIRQFKGTNVIESASAAKLMDVDGGYGQWANVSPTYNDYFGLPDRDFDGYKDPVTGDRLHYTNTTGRNDIYDAKVARDWETVYFMVRTVDTLTYYGDNDWMRLYIDMGDSHADWENYEFVLNKTSPEDDCTAYLERFTGNGYETEIVGTVEYFVNGNYMVVAIPKTMLGISIESDEFTIDFKWVDNANEDEEGDIMNWYINGDVAPVGRFNFRYTTATADAVESVDYELGYEVLDFTDADVREEMETYSFVKNQIKTTATFGENGLTLTVSEKASNNGVVLNYSDADVQMIGENHPYIVITYRTQTETSLRIATGAGTTIPAASPVRAKAVDLVADGEIHTVVYAPDSRIWNGYIKELGLFFAKDVEVGTSIEILSIEMSEIDPTATE